MSQSRCCSQCGSNGHNSRTCSSSSSSSPTAVADDESSLGEIMLFGVRVKVDPMRKSVSMNNLSQYEHPNEQQSSNADAAAAAIAVAADTGYASADDAAGGRNQSNGSRERKRGTPWTEDEHKLFLIGLQKVGKGDWRGISRNFVKTRTPTQVASHAQKYFLRRSNLNRRRRRSSLFDITTDTVAAIPMEEEQVHQYNNTTSQSAIPPPMVPSQEISPLSGFPMAPFPATVGPVLIPVQIENPMEKLTLGSRVNGSMIPVRPIPSLPMANASSSDTNNLSQKPAIDPSPMSLKLSLSLSSDHYQPRQSAFQVMSSFNNGDNFITVA